MRRSRSLAWTLSATVVLGCLEVRTLPGDHRPRDAPALLMGPAASVGVQMQKSDPLRRQKMLGSPPRVSRDGRFVGGGARNQEPNGDTR